MKKIKKTRLLSGILAAALLTACGSGYESSDTYSASPAQNFAGSSKSNGDYASDIYVEVNSSDEYESADVADSDAASSQAAGDETLKKEMLVYSCNMSVDVLDFQTAADTFKASLDTYGAFVENENYSDGGSSGHWVYSDSEKWQSYSATVRVPSEKYDDFCNAAAGLGSLRSKNASVENMSREYYDLSDTLEIYEAKEKRYTELLKTIQDEAYAIKVEETLTDIQIEIAKLKTRMNDIRTDVAYSYVYITINEVKEYVSEPVKTDTFLQRLSNTVKDATDGFLDFLEWLLFALIYLFPYIVIAVFVIFIIRKSAVKRKKRRELQDFRPEPTAAPPSYIHTREETSPAEIKEEDK